MRKKFMLIAAVLLIVMILGSVALSFPLDMIEGGGDGGGGDDSGGGDDYDDPPEPPEPWCPPHSWTSYADSFECGYYCTVCDSYNTSLHTYVLKQNESYHWLECSKCRKEKNRASHVFSQCEIVDQTEHRQNCSICNYQKRGLHTDFTLYDYVDTTGHRRTCSKCSYVIAAIEPHVMRPWKKSPADGGQQRSCRHCNHIEYMISLPDDRIGEEIGECPPHIYGAWQHCNDNMHKRACVLCGFTEAQPHNYGAWSQNLNEHKRACLTCGYIQRGNHNYDNWEYYNNNEHRQICYTCGYVRTENHEYNAWVYYNNETHKAICEKCNSTVMQQHKFECSHVTIKPHVCDDNWLRYDDKLHERQCLICHGVQREPHTYNEAFEALIHRFERAEEGKVSVDRMAYYAPCFKCLNSKLFMYDYAPEVYFSVTPPAKVENSAYVYVEWIGKDSDMRVQPGFKTTYFAGTPTDELIYTLEFACKDELLKTRILEKVELPNGGEGITRTQFDITKHNDIDRVFFRVRVKDRCPDDQGGGLFSKWAYTPEFKIVQKVEELKPGLNYTNEPFMEGSENDGSVPTKKIVTLVGDRFKTDGLRKGIDYTTANVPEGLELLVDIINTHSGLRPGEEVVYDKAVLYMVGKAKFHRTADSRNNITISFKDSAFIGGNPSKVALVKNDMKLEFMDNEERKLIYSDDTFMESSQNDGTVLTEIEVKLTGDSFKDGQFVKGVDYATSSEPEDLRLIVEKVSNKRVLLYLIGIANKHSEKDSISNLTVRFKDSAFLYGNASEVVNSNKNDLKINFKDNERRKLNYFDDTFTEGFGNDGFVPTEITVTLAGDRFRTDGLRKGIDYTAKNVPEGLELFVEKMNVPAGLRPGEQIPNDRVTIYMTGKANKHNAEDDINNLTVIFKDSAFICGKASEVDNSNKDDLKIKFEDNKRGRLNYSDDTFMEGLGNDGFVPTKITVTLAGDRFRTDGLRKGIDYTAKNVPEGLELFVEKMNVPAGLRPGEQIPNDRVTIYMTGKANKHNVEDDINNLTISFKDSAFLYGNASEVVDSNKNNLRVLFISDSDSGHDDEPELCADINVENDLSYVYTKGGYGIEINRKITVYHENELLTEVNPVSDEPDDSLSIEYYIIRTSGDFESNSYIENLPEENPKLLLNKYNEIIATINSQQCIKVIGAGDSFNTACRLKMDYIGGDSVSGEFSFALPINEYSPYNHRKIYFAKDASNGMYSILTIVKGKVEVKVAENGVENNRDMTVRAYKLIRNAIKLEGTMYDDDSFIIWK